jgi:hypothetical protein
MGTLYIYGKLTLCRFSVKVHFTFGYCLLGQELQKHVVYVRYKIINLSCNEIYYSLIIAEDHFCPLALLNAGQNISGGDGMALVFGSSLPH